jgi:hypothetical protein
MWARQAARRTVLSLARWTRQEPPRFFKRRTLGGLLLIIPARVTDIGDESFCDCKSLRSIMLPKGLKTIGKRAFAQCRELESIVIPEGVETIEPGTFANCDALKTVTLLNANTKISPHAFNVDFKVEIIRP